jgi:hypothetical protein
LVATAITDHPRRTPEQVSCNTNPTHHMEEVSVLIECIKDTQPPPNSMASNEAVAPYLTLDPTSMPTTNLMQLGLDMIQQIQVSGFYPHITMGQYVFNLTLGSMQCQT